MLITGASAPQCFRSSPKCWTAVTRPCPARAENGTRAATSDEAATRSAATEKVDVLRLHFTAGDLMRVRLAPRPAPLMELGLATATLQRRDDHRTFGHWRAERRRALPSPALPLFGLVPPNGAGPLFLDPLTETFEEGLEHVRSTPRDVAVRELRRVCPAYRPVTTWVRDLSRQDRRAWQTLAEALRTAHRALLSRQWDRVQAGFHADVAWRGRLLAEQGVGATLASLYPGSRWSGTTLHIDTPYDSDRTLSGGGLTLMPSTVWTGSPLLGCDDEGRDLFLYPTLTPLPLTPDQPDGDPLAALLGRTRAAVLRDVVRQRTTSEIAGDLEISLASASEHAGTLRAAGLIGSDRDGKHVWHSVTPLGAMLLRQR